MVLWKLSDLKRLIGPHLAHVQTIQIWGVRDAVMRFLLNHCPNLQDLTLCGWATLSDHAFEVSRNLKLRRLELIGATQQTNYIAIDACTLGRLVTYCPDLSEILLGCQVHIHAQTLLRHLQRAPSSRLRSLTLATRRTWSSQHVADLLELCPSLEKVCLLPAAAAGFDPEDMQKTSAQAWVTSHSHVLGLEHPFDKEQALAHNTIIHRSLTAAS
ncbi:hypothetical protein DFQ28_004999 [Apophysomyces sp. BC1034]|nr:hypothetical protein DFQ28_004999 [Apophysomyces sp. BC1034]